MFNFGSQITREKKVSYFLLCCGCFTISFNVAAIVAAIPAMSVDLRIPGILVSDVIPYYMIPYGVGALLYAPLTRYFSYKRILGISLFCYALACFYCANIRTIQHFLLGRVIMGVSGAGVIPLGLMIIGQLFEKNVRGRLVGMFFSFSFLASISGLILSGTVHWRWLFWIPSLIGVVTALSILFLSLEPFAHICRLKIDYINTLKKPCIGRIFGFIAFISFLFHGVQKWFGVYLAESYHLNQMMISSLLLIPPVSGALGQMMGGYLSDKKGRAAACLIGLLILSLSTMSLYGKYPLLIVGLILGLVSFGWTIGHNGISTILTDFPDTHRSEIASLNSALRFIGGGVGFKISKFFINRGMSFEMNFLLLGVCMLFSGFFLKKIIPD